MELQVLTHAQEGTAVGFSCRTLSALSLSHGMLGQDGTMTGMFRGGTPPA